MRDTMPDRQKRVSKEHWEVQGWSREEAHTQKEAGPEQAADGQLWLLRSVEGGGTETSGQRTPQGSCPILGRLLWVSFGS